MSGRPRAHHLPFVLLALLVASCSPGPLTAPEGPHEVVATLPEADGQRADPAGRVTVAYPEEPSSFVGTVGEEPARDDLAALWGLPLLRIDDAGQVRRGLVGDWTVVGDTPAGWQVRLALRHGTWSDGTAVDAADVVATVRSRVRADPARFGGITDVAPTDDGDVVVTFDRPYAAWADLLVEAGPMAPSEPAAEGTAEPGLPVSGGWFRLVEHEPGLRLVFDAHTDGPLGAPALERVEVLFVPSFETALGLADEGEVDALLGYLPLNGVARATEVTGVRAASPLGGTMVALQFRPDGGLGGEDMAPRRRGIAETVDVPEIVEGMLGRNGDAASSPWPEVPDPTDLPVGEVRENQSIALLFPSGGEILGFTARAIQRDLTARGMTVDLVGVPAPRFSRELGQERDVALVVRRTSRRPSLAPFVADPAVANDAAAAPLGSPAVEQGLQAVGEQARLAPLFRVGVLHAWRDIEGVRPSAWLGAGFWNVGEWSIQGDA